MGNWRIGLVAAMATLLAASAASGLTADETAALQRASARGQAIYAYDQAAWVATDEMLRQLPDEATHPHGGGGWVVEARGGSLRVVFYHAGAGEPRAFFTADVTGGRVVSSHVLQPGDDGRLSPLDLRMIAARQVAAQQGKTPCGAATFNTVVLPPASPGGAVVVYLLTPQLKTGEYPAGGHYEVDVAADGSVASSRPFTRSCLTLGGPAPAPDMRPAGMFVTHLLDPTPTEIHVYLSLWSKETLFVGTQAPALRVWEVNGSTISLAPTPSR
jgi:hypothetical protein